MFSPLETFSNHPHLINQDILTLASLALIFILTSKIPFLKKGWTQFYLGMLTLSPQTWALPLISSLFILVIGSNLLGLFPYTFSLTAQFAFSLGLSITLWTGNLLTSLQNQGLGFLAHFLPPGIPLPLATLLIPIECLSYLAKALSLGIRLSANIISGHLLILVLQGFIPGVGSLSPVSTLLVIILSVLEITVCLIQAYVFVNLTGIYMEESMPH